MPAKVYLPSELMEVALRSLLVGFPVCLYAILAKPVEGATNYGHPTAFPQEIFTIAKLVETITTALLFPKPSRSVARKLCPLLLPHYWKPYQYDVLKLQIWRMP